MRGEEEARSLPAEGACSQTEPLVADGQPAAVTRHAWSRRTAQLALLALGVIACASIGTWLVSSRRDEAPAQVARTASHDGGGRTLSAPISPRAPSRGLARGQGSHHSASHDGGRTFSAPIIPLASIRGLARERGLTHPATPLVSGAHGAGTLEEASSGNQDDDEDAHDKQNAEPVDGFAPADDGAGRACRADPLVAVVDPNAVGCDTSSENKSGCLVFQMVKDVNKCKDLCRDTQDCTGVEYSAKFKRCEVWKVKLGPGSLANGFECHAFSRPCASVGENCQFSGCCLDAGYTCYEKNPWWASCRQSCKEGQKDEGGPDNIPWTCKELPKVTDWTPQTSASNASGDGEKSDKSTSEHSKKTREKLESVMVEIDSIDGEDGEDEEVDGGDGAVDPVVVTIEELEGSKPVDSGMFPANRTVLQKEPWWKEWEVVDGTSGHCQSEVIIPTQVDKFASLGRCKALCKWDPDCKGIEYSADFGYCERWQSPIVATIPAGTNSVVCLALKHRGPEVQAVPASRFRPIDGGVNRKCSVSDRRLAAGSADEAANVDTNEEVDSLSHCQELCKMHPKCAGISFNLNDRRCDVWKKMPDATEESQRSVCLSYSNQTSKPELVEQPTKASKVHSTTTKAGNKHLRHTTSKASHSGSHKSTSKHKKASSTTLAPTASASSGRPDVSVSVEFGESEESADEASTTAVAEKEKETDRKAKSKTGDQPTFFCISVMPDEPKAEAKLLKHQFEKARGVFTCEGSAVFFGDDMRDILWKVRNHSRYLHYDWTVLVQPQVVFDAARLQLMPSKLPTYEGDHKRFFMRYSHEIDADISLEILSNEAMQVMFDCSATAALANKSAKERVDPYDTATAQCMKQNGVRYESCPWLVRDTTTVEHCKDKTRFAFESSLDSKAWFACDDASSNLPSPFLH